MLVLDNSLLSDYLAGKRSARSFLEPRSDEVWTVPSIVVYEAYMGAVHGYLGADVETIQSSIEQSIEVLNSTGQTTAEAATLQSELLDRGVPAEHPDALIAASASEHGGTFATGDRYFWADEVREVLDIAAYDPGD